MQRVVITGSSGYVGGRLVASFRERGCRVLGIDVRPAAGAAPDDFLRRDVRDPALVDDLRSFAPDTVIHAAFVVQPRRDQRETRRMNVEGSRNVLAAVAAVRPRRLLFISSATVYGAWPDNPLPMDDDQPLRPRSEFPYAAEKAEVERLLDEFSARHPEIAVSWVRPTIVGGPHMNNYLRRIIFGFPFLVKLDGSDTPFQLVHEDDLVAAVRAVLEADGRGAYNVSPTDRLCYSQLGERTKRWVVWVPFWLGRLVYGGGWMLRLPYPETPPGFLYYVRHPWIIRSRRLQEELGFRFRYSAAQTMEAVLGGGAG